jgi:DeoR family fructose operon transcriptional repressor
VPHHGAIALDASTTTNAIAVTLAARPGLVVTTNSTETFDVLSSMPGVEAHLTGGRREPETGSLVGPIANLGARAVQAELFLASAASVNAEAGSSEVSLAEAEVKRHFAASARRTLLCVDSSKLGQWSMGSALMLAEVSVLITELDPADARLDAYRPHVEIR